jgi:hypothetical protein
MRRITNTGYALQHTDLTDLKQMGVIRSFKAPAQGQGASMILIEALERFHE